MNFGDGKLLRSARVRILLLMASDLLCIFGLLMLSAALFGDRKVSIPPRNGWDIMVWAAVFWCSAIQLRLYHGNILYPGCAIGPIEEIRRLCAAITLGYVSLFAYLSLSGERGNFSRTPLFCAWIASILLLPICRFFIRYLMKKLNIGRIPAVIAGMGRTGTMLRDVLERDNHFGFRINGFFDDNKPCLGKLSDLNAYARRNKVGFLILCLPPDKLIPVIRDCSKCFSHIIVVPDNAVLPISWSYPINLCNFGSLEISNHLMQRMSLVFKKIVEIMLAIFAVILLLPLFLILILVVKLSSRGPVFYIANRLGRGGVPIKVFKFRTMYADADERLKKLLDNDPELAREWNEKFKLDNDPRVTPIGRWLRKTSLDELPQLLNVIRGEMALIGPRPIVKEEIAYYGNDYDIFKRVKPGITGLWQVSGRSDLSYEERVKIDVIYVLNWSIWLDYYIFIRTIREVLSGRGAK